MRVIAISSRGIPSGGFVYGLPHLIAKRIGRNFDFRISLPTRCLSLRPQEGWDLAAFLSPLRYGFCSLAPCLCRQLFTLAGDDRRNLWWDDQANGSRFADMLEEDRVALFFLPVCLHDIELRAANAERRHDTRYVTLCANHVGKAMQNSDRSIKGIHIGRASASSFVCV
jgi:hypothetical protein